MKQLPYFIICLLLVFTGCKSSKIIKVQEALDRFCENAVPDSRVGVCHVEAYLSGKNSIVLKGETMTTAMRDELVNIATKTGRMIVDSILVLPDTAHVKITRGIVSVSVANLRSRPSHSAELVSQAVMGTPVRILKRTRGWFFIQTPDNYLSWTNTSSVEPKDEVNLNAWNSADKIILMANNGSVYTERSKTEIFSDLAAGCILEKLEEFADVYLVRLPDGREGYVPKEGFAGFEIWKENPVFKPEEWITTARQFQGLPYMWGGTASKALDCSGFMKNVFLLNGIILERDASQQFKYGTVVEEPGKVENLQVGDLLFFGSKEPIRIIHVGMYIGNSRVIHASGLVQVNSLIPGDPDFSEYLHDTWVGTKRLTNMKPQFGFMPVRDHEWYRSGILLNPARQKDKGERLE